MKIPLRQRAARTLRWLAAAAAVVTLGSLLLLLGFIVARGLPYLRPSLFSPTYTSENVSLLPALRNTLILTALALLMAVPTGMGAAIYLSEYARRGSRLVGWVRRMAETLAGIPSIVYGLFGLLFFVTALGWGFSLLAGACTLALMLLPLIMRTTEEALHSVPAGYREGSFGLGAGRLRTVLSVVLPAAAPGIVSGVVLAVGRALGETAALVYTAGTVADVPAGLLSSGRTLAVHMYVLANEGLYVGQAYATAVVLVVLVAVLNALAAGLTRRLERGRSHD